MSARRSKQGVVVVVRDPPRAQQSTSQKKKKTKRQRPNRDRRMKQATQEYLREQMKVHPCTIQFMKTLAFPFNPAQNAGTCLPDDNDVPSFKFHARARGELTTNATGFGCVGLSYLCGSNSQINSILYTGASYAGSTVPGTGAATGVTYQPTNSPFSNSTSNVANIPLTRPVAVALRLRYTGAQLYMGGQVIGFKAKASALVHQKSNFNGGFSTLANMYLQNPVPVSRKWVTMVWTPMFPQDKEYTGTNVSSGINNQIDNRDMGFIINCPSDHSLTFEWEAVYYYEAIPSLTADTAAYPPEVTASDSDSSGYAFVKDVMGHVADNVSGEALWNAFTSFARNASAGFVPLAASLARQRPAAIEYL